jgi:hypothetical protein
MGSLSAKNSSEKFSRLGTFKGFSVFVGNLEEVIVTAPALGLLAGIYFQL